MSAIRTLNAPAPGEYAADITLSLEKRTLVGLHDSRDARVRVDAGLVWVTQEGDSRDYLVGAGNTLRLDCDGLALVHALRDSSITVMAPPAHALSPERRAFELRAPRATPASAS